MSSSKYTNYFTKIDLPTKLNQWKCNNCSYKTKQVTHTSTSSLENHLEKTHKKLYNELMAKEKRIIASNKRRSTTQHSDVPAKQLKIMDGMLSFL